MRRCQARSKLPSTWSTWPQRKKSLSRSAICGSRSLYYVQGWSLAIRGKPMFPERIEAWAGGPVVPDVYHRLKKRHWSPVKPEDFADASGPAPNRQEEGFIRQVWDGYKAHSAIGLAQLTHEERPWRDARKGLSSSQASNRPITPAVLKKYFSERAAT